MHAPVFKRTTLNQIILSTLALGLAASLALNVALFVRSDGDTTQPAAVQNVAPASSDANTGQIDVDQFLANQSVAQAQRDASGSIAGQIDVDQMLVSQNAVPAAASRSTAANAGLIDVDELLAARNITPAQANAAGPHQGLINVDELLAEQRFAPTALDLFVIDAAR